MQDTPNGDGRKTTGDEEATLVTPPVEDARGVQPRMRTPLPLTGNARATLTLLTGLHAGHITAIDGDPVTVGRASDADLVVDDASVSRHHVRITHMRAGGFCAEDLGSTNGTFVGATRVGVAVLHRDELIQLGAHVQLRFAIIDLVEETITTGIRVG